MIHIGHIVLQGLGISSLRQASFKMVAKKPFKAWGDIPLQMRPNSPEVRITLAEVWVIQSDSVSSEDATIEVFEECMFECRGTKVRGDFFFRSKLCP